ETRGEHRRGVVAERPIAGRQARLLEQTAAKDLRRLRGPEALPLDLLARRAGFVGATDRVGKWQSRDRRAVTLRDLDAALEEARGDEGARGIVDRDDLRVACGVEGSPRRRCASRTAGDDAHAPAALRDGQ